MANTLLLAVIITLDMSISSSKTPKFESLSINLCMHWDLIAGCRILCTATGLATEVYHQHLG